MSYLVTGRSTVRIRMLAGRVVAKSERNRTKMKTHRIQAVERGKAVCHAIGGDARGRE